MILSISHALISATKHYSHPIQGLTRRFDAVSCFRKETDSSIDSETSHTEQSFIGALGRNRTCDLRIRSPLLYPTELRGH
jgi:hypothetical protein